MNAIVSVTRDWGIGLGGRLLVHNRADMRRFVALTRPGTVLMGRTTFEGFPKGPLPGRRNVVVSSTPGFAPEGVEVARSPDEALALVATDDPEHVWLIGGGRLYDELLDSCARAYVTRNDVAVPADTWFPDLDRRAGWELEREEPGGVTEGGVPFSFRTYRNIAATEAAGAAGVGRD